MRRIQRLCGLQLVWLLFLDTKWQAGRQITLFCGVSRNDEAIRRVVLSPVYRNSAIALRSIKLHLRFLSWGTSCIRFRPQASMHCCSTCGKLAYNLHRLPFFTTSRKPEVQSQSCGSFMKFRLCVGEPWLFSVQKLYKCTKSSHVRFNLAGV